MKIKVAVFDLDGTLSDSIASMKYCGDRAVAPFGIGPFPESDYKYFVGDGAANLVKRALIKGGDTELVHFEEAFALYKGYFAVDCMYKVQPYEGVVQALADLKAAGIKLAVLSNKPHDQTIDVIETLFGKDCFDMILGQREGVPIKPDPAGVLEIAKAQNCELSEILYIGDTSTDMKTGKSAGAFTVGVLWGFRTRQELEDNHADAIIAHPSELLHFI